MPGGVLAAVPVMPMPGRERALLLHRGVVVVVQAVMVLQRAAG